MEMDLIIVKVTYICNGEVLEYLYLHNDANSVIRIVLIKWEYENRKWSDKLKEVFLGLINKPYMTRVSLLVLRLSVTATDSRLFINKCLHLLMQALFL